MALLSSITNLGTPRMVGGEVAGPPPTPSKAASFNLSLLLLKSTLFFFFFFFFWPLMNMRNLQSEANQFWDEMREIDVQSTWILDSNQINTPWKRKKKGKNSWKPPYTCGLAKKKVERKKTNSFLSAWLERFLRFRYLLNRQQRTPKQTN